VTGAASATASLLAFIGVHSRFNCWIQVEISRNACLHTGEWLFTDPFLFPRCRGWHARCACHV
jgi:hypothetical protein